MPTSLDDVKLTLVESSEEYDAFRRWLGEHRRVLAVDIETTGLSLAKDRIRTVQFGDTQSGWCLPWEDWRGGSWSGAVRQVLREYEGPLVLQHAKFDAGFLQREGVKWPWHRTHDTMIMNFLVNSMGPKSLKPAAAYYLEEPAARAGEQELKRAMHKNGWTYASIPIDFPGYWAYGALDTVLTARLAEVQWYAMQPYIAAYDLELACERVLCDMELRGVRVDVEYCEEQERVHLGELVDVVAQLAGIAGPDFNPGSSDQVVAALEREGVKLTKRTEKGKLSVDEEVLSSVDNNVARLVLEHRTLEKLVGSFFSNFIRYNRDGRVHPHINQLQARTGRMSVTEPALQTVPRKKVVRDAFIPDEGQKMILVDYDNEELRVAAHFAGDQNMIDALAEGRDLHGETAARLYGPGYTPAQRTTAKNARFSWLYGAGVPKFARTAGIPESEAAAVFRTLSEMSPGMARTMTEVVRRVRERAAGSEFGWITISDGRNLKVKADKAYAGFNFLVQGSCAVVLKQSIVDLDAAGLGDFIRLPIHDELILSVPEGDLDAAVPEIQRCMTREDWRVPLTVSPKIVDRWGDEYE